MRPLVCLLLLLTLCLPACTHEQPPRPAIDQPQVTITFAALEDDHAVYQPLLAAFMQGHPAIQVVLLSLDEILYGGETGDTDGSDALTRRIVTHADVFPSIFVSSGADHAHLLLNLKPLMEADATFQADDFYPGVLERAIVNDNLWELPQSFQIPLLVYNKTLVQRVHLPAPEHAVTFDELLAMAEQLSLAPQPNNADTYGLLDPSGGTATLLALLQTQGIDLAHQPLETIQLDQPGVIAAIQRMQALMEQRALLVPGYRGNTAAAAPAQLLLENRLGFWLEDIPPAAIDAGFLPLPVELYQLPGYLGYGYSVSAGTAHPQAAWELITFLSQQPIGDLTSAAPRQIPARQSTAAAAHYWETLNPELAAAYQWAITHTNGTFPRSPDPLLIDALQQVLQVTLAEAGDPTQALRTAQQQLQQTLANQQLTPVPSPAAAPIVVATPQPTVAAQSIRVSFTAAGYSLPAMRDLARSFQEQHPDIALQIQSTDAFTMPPTLEMLAQTSDCFIWSRPILAETDFTALLDLQPLLDADPTFAADAYPPAVLHSYRYDEKLIGLPYAIVPLWLVYNQTAFETVGIPAPSATWTRDDFLAAAQRLTNTTGSATQYGYVPAVAPGGDLFFFIAQAGGQLTTGSGTEIQPNFTDPTVVAAIQWYIDLAKVYQVMPPLRFPHTPDDMLDSAYEDLIRSGRAGMWFDISFPAFEAEEFVQNAAPLPVGEAGLHASDFMVKGMFISAQTEQIQPCWEWLKFLSHDATNVMHALPARTTLAQTEAFLQQVPPEMTEQYRAYADVIQHAVPINDIPRLQQMDLYWFYEALTRTIEHDADLATELAWAQQMTTAFMACRAAQHDEATCAARVDPDYHGYSVP